MQNDNVSNNKFIFMSIFLMTFCSFFAFLIGYGINSGSCPICKDKKIIKVFTTVNNIVNNIDYNMLTSEIKKELIGKYVNNIDAKSYFEINENGEFEFVRNSCNKYEKFTNEDYVLLIYYSKKENESIEGVELSEDDILYEYATNMTLIPKNEITTDNLIDSMITFKNNNTLEDGTIDSLVGPVTCSTSNVYVKE